MEEVAADPFPYMDLAYSYAAFFLAYLIGSVSFAVIISKVMRLPDPRSFGSGNPGATNVLRAGNKTAAVLVLLLDGLKGFVPVALARYYSLDFNFEETTIAFVGVAAFIGHLFPVFHRFKGGKGVATAGGALLAYSAMLGGATLLIWVLIAAVFRYSSLASILAAAFAPMLALVLYERPVVVLAVCVMSFGLVWRHWRNIVKLLTGTETRIGEQEPEKPRRRRRRAHRIPHGVTPRRRDPGPSMFGPSRSRSSSSSSSSSSSKRGTS